MKNNILNKLALIATTMVLGIGLASAQPQLDSRGDNFWLTFPGNIDFGSGNIVFFSISGDVAATGMWEIPGLGISDTFSVTPGVVTNVPIPNSAQITSSDGVTDQGIHVTATAEVTVYGVNLRDASTDAYLGLPSDILGTEYVVLGYQGNVAPSQMTIVGTEDNTIVTITPSFNSGGRIAGVPYVVNLDQGEVYQMRAFGSSNDVSGTLISSDKKVAVYGGNQCVNVPTGFGFCDIIVEQIPPINTLGKSFVALPLATRSGSTFRVIASQDTTILLKDGSIVATLNKGEFYEVIDSTEVVFEASKPVLVAQYCHGQTWDGVVSDPFMMLIPPYEQYLGSYTVSTPSSPRLTDHYLNIIAPNNATGTVLLNGVLIPSGDFTPIGTSGFSGVTRSVAIGSHTVSSTSPIGIHSYGFGAFDSYGYPGGQSLSEVASADSLSLSLATGIAPQGDTVCVVQATVLDSANQPLPGIRVDFSLTGSNAQTGFGFTDSNGVATLCYYAANAGWDTVSASTGGLTAKGEVLILPCSISLSSSQVDILNGNPGSINLTVTGNVSPPTYAWTGPNGFTASTQDVAVTDSGTYKVVVTDPFFSDCKDSLEVVITASTTPCTLVLGATKVDIVNGAPGSINLTVSGFNGTPTYIWTGPNGFTATTQDIAVSDSGTYKVVVTDPGAPDCQDSLEVTITESTTSSCTTVQSFTICDGDSVLVNGRYISVAGVYHDTTSTGGICDSVLQTTLHVNPVYNTVTAVTICFGDSIFLEGAFQTTAGVYTDVWTSIDGCDSTVQTTLTLDSAGCSYDCNGDLNGTAFIDACATCVGGNTGLSPCSPGCVNLEVVSLSLIDATTGVEIRVLMDGDTIDKSAGPFSVRANTCSGPVGSVLFYVNGSLMQTENLVPYDINGGTLVMPFAWNPVAGPYSIVATPYSGTNGRGITGISEIVNVEIVDSTFTSDCNGVPGGSAFIDSCGICVGGNTGRTACVPPCMELEVISFMLVNATTGNQIGLLQNGDVIDKSMVGPFSIRAIVCNDPVGSVLFDLNGSIVMKENLVPYDINGGTITMPNAWNPAPGVYTLVGRPYSKMNGRGVQGITETVTFTVIDGVGLQVTNTGSSTDGISKELERNTISDGSQSLGSVYLTASDIGVYPNPTTGLLYIKVPYGTESNILLLDNSGRLLKEVSTPQKAEAKAGTYELDLSQLPRGIYLIQVITNEQVFSRRVIKN